MSSQKTRCAGTKTEAGFRAWVISLLRRGTVRWKPRSEALKRARATMSCGSRRSPQAYMCELCGGLYPSKGMRVDHVSPVVGWGGFSGWDAYIDALFCESGNLQAICCECHDRKTGQERKQRAEARKQTS